MQKWVQLAIATGGLVRVVALRSSGCIIALLHTGSKRSLRRNGSGSGSEPLTSVGVSKDSGTRLNGIKHNELLAADEQQR